MAQYIGGSVGKDKIKGVEGDQNYIWGGDGDDELLGRSLADHLFGGQGDDRLRGGAGDDRLEGGDGADELHGGSGNDKLEGGSGDDYFITGSGRDVVEGGGGFDTVDFRWTATSVVVDLSKGTADVASAGQVDRQTLKSIEQVFGSTGDDVLTGSKRADILNGDGGNDMIRSGLGLDKVTGGAGSDTFVYRAGDVADDTRDWILDFEVGVDRLDLTGFSKIEAHHVASDEPGMTTTIVVGWAKGEFHEVAALVNVHAEVADFWLV